MYIYFDTTKNQMRRKYHMGECFHLCPSCSPDVQTCAHLYTCTHACNRIFPLHHPTAPGNQNNNFSAHTHTMHTHTIMHTHTCTQRAWSIPVFNKLENMLLPVIVNKLVLFKATQCHLQQATIRHHKILS